MQRNPPRSRFLVWLGVKRNVAVPCERLCSQKFADDVGTVVSIEAELHSARLAILQSLHGDLHVPIPGCVPNRYQFGLHVTKPGDWGRFAGIAARLLRRRNQIGQLSLRVVRRNPPALVAEQVLPIFKRHSGRSQAAAERVFQVVNPNSPESVRRRFASKVLYRSDI